MASDFDKYFDNSQVWLIVLIFLLSVQPTPNIRLRHTVYTFRVHWGYCFYISNPTSLCVTCLRLLQLFQSWPRILLFLHFYSAPLRVTWCKVATIITNIIIFINVSVADNDFVVRFIHHEHIVRATTGTAANIKKREEINNDQTYCFSHNSLIGR